MFKVISTVKAPAAIGPYSQAIVADMENLLQSDLWMEKLF